MAVLTVTAENYNATVLQAGKPVLIEFYADWCGPCKALAPVLEDLSAENPAFQFCKINIDESRDIADKMGILSVPTLLLLQNKTVMDTLIGYHNKAEILQFLQKQR